MELMQRTLTVKQWANRPNAGDAFGAVVIAHLTGRNVEVANEEPLDRPHLVGIGSILHWADRWSTVWGTGLLHGGVPVASPRRIAAVRGPLTAARLRELGLATPDTLGDPGVFAPDVFPTASSRQGIGIVPHYVDLESDWVGAMRAAGAVLVDPLAPLPEYMAALSGCEAIASSSLHGIIFAHAYGIPAVHVQLSDRVLGEGFKFDDYRASIGNADDPTLDTTADLQTIKASCSLPERPLDSVALLASLPELDA
jgi:pyruvyltransferase